MKNLRSIFIPQDCPKQALRIRRMCLSLPSHAISLLLGLACWKLKYLEASTIILYMTMILGSSVGFYLMIRSDLNLRFADPSMTLVQVISSIPPWLYVMYFAGDARTVFLLLTFIPFLFGLFKLRTRDFVIHTVLGISGYLLLIATLLFHRPEAIVLQLEILNLMALFATMVLFCVMGGYMGGLRSKVNEKNIELGKRNLKLEETLLELEKSTQRNRELAIRDELTGVYNRRYLMEMIEMEKKRCDRSSRIFSLCIVDIDFFKSVNDTYGHLAGDEVLRGIATSIAEGMRQSDYFGRYGGEEFAMVLNDTSMAGALTSAERVRERIEGSVFPGISLSLKVTISIGISQFRQNEDTTATFKRADEALYRAKDSGRNCCVAGDVRVEQTDC